MLRTKSLLQMSIEDLRTGLMILIQGVVMFIVVSLQNYILGLLNSLGIQFIVSFPVH